MWGRICAILSAGTNINNLPHKFKTWNEYYKQTGDWSVGPARTIINSERLKKPN